MSDLRKNLECQLKERGWDHADLSVKLGKNRGFLYDWLHRRRKGDLDLTLWGKIEDLTGITGADVGLDEKSQRMLRRRHDAAALGDDVEPCSPPPGFRAAGKWDFYLLKTNALELHPMGAKVGDILRVDPSKTANGAENNGQAFIVRVPLDPADSTYRLLAREFVEPGQFFTNRTAHGEIFCIDDRTFPARPRVLGLITKLDRDVA